MRRLAPLLLVVAACSSAASTSTSPSTDTSPFTAPTTAISTTTSTSAVGAGPPAPTIPVDPPEKALYDHWKGSFAFGDGLRIDVYAPDERSNHPIAVTIHGGAWYAGSLESMGGLADGLADRGFVVFNAGYHTILRGGTFPSMVSDVACAVVYARRHALDYSTDDTTLALIGHSAGAHLSALVAFAPETFGSTCPDPRVDVFVGLAGSYDTDAYAGFLDPFYGVSQADDPARWAEGNPKNLVAGIDPGLDVLLIHGDADELVPSSMSEELAVAVEPYAAVTRFRLIHGAGHGEVTDPALVGDLIAEFVTAPQ